MAKKKEVETIGLEAALNNIKKMFGKESLIYGENRGDINIESYPLEIIGLNKIFGGKGLPKGRIIEIYGPEGSGKTTLCLGVLSQLQKTTPKKKVAFIDAEHCWDDEWAIKNNIDLSNLILHKPDYGEMGLEVVEALVSSGEVSCIIVDSVAELVPKAELEGSMDDNHVGLQSRMMSQALRKLTGIADKTGCTVIFTNQIRTKIGVMFGNPETTPGGKALKFHSSIRLDVRRTSFIKDGEEIIGSRLLVKTIKSKIGGYPKAEFDIMLSNGLDRHIDLIKYAVEENIIEKSGSWYSYNDLRIGQGEANVRNFLLENEGICESIRKETENKLKIVKENIDVSVGSIPEDTEDESDSGNPDD